MATKVSRYNIFFTDFVFRYGIVMPFLFGRVPTNHVGFPCNHDPKI